MFDFNEFVDWSFLATYAGAMAVTGVITQFLKGLAPFDRLPTRVFAYIVALVVLLAAQAFTGQLTVSSAALAAVNAVIVAAATSGLVDAGRQITG